jgi:transposase
LPASRVNEIVAYVPTVCTDCYTPLPIDPGPDDPEPGWHQVAELPEQAAIVTEHQAHWRTCPCCGLANQAAIPAQIRAHAFGPRLAANMSYLSGRFHLGKRSVKEFVEAVYQVPVSLGTVMALEQQTSVALIAPHDEARDVVRQAPVKNADETGWKQAGAKRWLWTAATTSAPSRLNFGLPRRLISGNLLNHQGGCHEQEVYRAAGGRGTGDLRSDHQERNRQVGETAAGDDFAQGRRRRAGVG